MGYFDGWDGNGTWIGPPVSNRRTELIPGSRHYRYGKYGRRILRRPRTTQERRQLCGEAADEDIGLYRIKSRRRWLPTAWDDQTRSDWDGRKSWKTNAPQRQRQWWPD